MDDDDRRHGNTQDSGVWNRSIWMMMTGDTGTRKTVRCVEQAYMDELVGMITTSGSIIK